MKNLILSVTMVVLGVLCALPAAAQTEPLAGRVKASIPFEFMVGDQVMPPGDYLIQSTGMQDTWQIKNVNIPSAQAHVMVTDLEEKDVNADTRLIFRNVGEKRVLSEVWATGTTHGHGFSPRGQE